MLFGSLLSWFVRMVPMTMTTYLIGYAVTWTMSMGLPPIVISLIAGYRFFPLAPCRRMNAVDAFLGVLVAIGGCMLSNIISSYVTAFLQSMGAESPTMPDYIQPTLQSLLLNIVVFAVLPALFEEMVFRGYVLRTLRAYGDWFAVLVSSVLFGLMHGNIEQIPFALLVGFLLGWLYIMTDNIWIPVTVHFTNNAYAQALDYLSIGLDDLRSGALFLLTMFLLIVLGLVAFIVVILRRSALLRRLPPYDGLGVFSRVVNLVFAPGFILCVVIYIVLTVLGS